MHTKNSAQYQIRSMDETDIDTVVQIEQNTWGDESWHSKHFFRALDDPFWHCWILESTTNGYSILGYGLQYFSYNESHIANLCIRPSQCGRGLGNILLNYMTDFARENGATVITLEVHTSNVRAYNLYVKHGFAIIEFLEGYYSKNKDAYRMQRILHRIY
jgi:ribosomal-protein-alanine N-acetyltransferase